MTSTSGVSGNPRGEAKARPVEKGRCGILCNAAVQVQQCKRSHPSRGRHRREVEVDAGVVRGGRIGRGRQADGDGGGGARRDRDILHARDPSTWQFRCAKDVYIQPEKGVDAVVTTTKEEEQTRWGAWSSSAIAPPAYFLLSPIDTPSQCKLESMTIGTGSAHCAAWRVRTGQTHVQAGLALLRRVPGEIGEGSEPRYSPTAVGGGMH